MVRYSFPVGLLHPQLPAGLSRRFRSDPDCPRLPRLPEDVSPPVRFGACHRSAHRAAQLPCHVPAAPSAFFLFVGLHPRGEVIYFESFARN
jgi:hypothetical protein